MSSICDEGHSKLITNNDFFDSGHKMIQSALSTGNSLPEQPPFTKTAAKSAGRPVSPSLLAVKLITYAEKIQPELQKKTIDFCRKSLFARTIDQLNKRSGSRHQLPLSLERLLNPTNPDQWDWDKWSTNKNSRDHQRLIFLSIKKKLPVDDRLRDFLSNFLTNQWPREEQLDSGLISSIVYDSDPIEDITNQFRTRCIHVVHFIKAAIKEGMLDIQFINELYDQYSPKTLPNCGATSSPHCYQGTSVDKLICHADELASGLFALSLEDETNCQQPLSEFISVLNQEYSCGVNVLGNMPINPDNNPTSVDDPTWLTWQHAVYDIADNQAYLRNDDLFDSIKHRLLQEKIDPVTLYNAFKCDEDILGLHLDLGEYHLHLKNISPIELAIANCEGKGKPITKLITGLIRFGCLTKKCIEDVERIGISNLKNVF